MYQAKLLTTVRPLVGPGTTTLIALLIYLLTMASDLSWANYGGDGGELITASFTLGVPHPPGYPTYVLLGKLFSYVPIGTIAYRYNLFSAISVAVAAGFVTASVSILLAKGIPENRTRHKLVPIATGLLFAFIPLVWGQALIAEVYALNLVFLAGLVWLLSQEKTGRRSLIAGILFGLSLTTHLSSILILPLTLFVLPRRFWPKFLAGTVVGLVPFLFLPLLSNTSSPLIWGESDSLSGWLWLAGARLYRPNIMTLPQDEWGSRVVAWGELFLRHFAWYGIPLIVIGWLSIRPRFRPLFLITVATVLVYTLYAFGYRTNDASVFLLPGILLLVVILGFGMNSLGSAALVLPALLVALNFSGLNIRGDKTVRESALGALNSLPSDSIVMTPGDQTVSTLWYYHFVENIRPDLIIVDQNMFQFDWYRSDLGSRYPSLLHLEADDLPGFVAANQLDRSICQVSLVTPPAVHCTSADDPIIESEL
jgi:hypothetical protein